MITNGGWLWAVPAKTITYNADALTRFDRNRLKAIEGMEENLVKRNVIGWGARL